MILNAVLMKRQILPAMETVHATGLHKSNPKEKEDLISDS